VVRNVYGGGNLASVGKGNYAGGADDYYREGYGERLRSDDEALWTPSTGYNPSNPITPSNSPKTMADYFLGSGKAEVFVTGGQIGYVNTEDPGDTMKDGLPYGNVYGGCRGESAPNVTESPRYLYCPQFFFGYVNEAKVVIGDAARINDDSYRGPRIYGSVFGGGQDGHVRRDTHVEVNKGEIGLSFTGSDLETGTGARTNQAILGGLQVAGDDNPQWLHRGNVYGAGSGISKYQYDFNYDKKIDDTVEGITYKGNPVKEEDYGTSAGSVMRNTQVDINGGIIHRNVYGGGSLASVGPPPIPPTRTDVALKETDATHGEGWLSKCMVNVSGTIGSPEGYDETYGGEVYGASRGDKNVIKTEKEAKSFATSVWTLVHIKDGAFVKGNVFGGGDNGKVKKDTDVKIGGE
jgi:hypothetical protein